MANRPICKPYFIDTHDLLEWNIPGAKRIHSSSLMHINYAAAEETIFPELVREFWGGARFDETGTLKGQVLDYDLSFDIDRISDLLQIPTGGEIYDKDWKRGKDMDDIRQTVYGAQEISNANATRVIYLTPAASLVFLMAVNVFCPRVSQHNYITDLDVFIIYHILKKIKLDPVNLVHQHLRRVQANNSMGIPYGFLITLYLRYMEPMRFAGWNQFARQEARQMSSAFLECRGVGTEERPESERDDDDDDDDVITAAAAADVHDGAGDAEDDHGVDLNDNSSDNESSSNVVNLSDCTSTSGSIFSGLTTRKRKRILPGSPSSPN